MFTDDAIEVCIKKFVHFLRKGFIKIITNISCLKAEERKTRLKDKNHIIIGGAFHLSNAKYQQSQEEEPVAMETGSGGVRILRKQTVCTTCPVGV